MSGFAISPSIWEKSTIEQLETLVYSLSCWNRKEYAATRHVEVWAQPWAHLNIQCSWLCLGSVHVFARASCSRSVCDVFFCFLRMIWIAWVSPLSVFLNPGPWGPQRCTDLASDVDGAGRDGKPAALWPTKIENHCRISRKRIEYLC